MNNSEYEIFATTSTNILKTVLKDNAALNAKVIELTKENSELKDLVKKEGINNGKSKQSGSNS